MASPEVQNQRFPEGERIFAEGDAADALFLVASGKIGLYRTIDGRKVLLRTLTAGAVIGVGSVVDGGTRTATAVTLAPSMLVRIPAPMMHQKMERADPLLRQVLVTLADQLRDARRSMQMRPRNVSDYVRLLQEQADNLGKFLINTHEVEDSARFAAQIQQLQAVIDELHQSVSSLNDRREEVYVDPAKLV